MLEVDHLYLSILSDYIHRRNTILSTSISKPIIKKLVYYAKIHNQFGILWKQCGKQISDIDSDIGEIIHNGFQNDVFRSVCYDTDFHEVCTLLNKNQIDFLPIKGILMRDYYPDRHFRTMSDIDILIRSDDVKKCLHLMEKVGFHSEVGNASVMIYTRDVVEYEFHEHMMYDTLVQNFDYQTYFDGLWNQSKQIEGLCEYRISENAHMLYLLTHLAKHIVNEGIGIRAFLDLALMIKNGCSLDWIWIQNELKKIYLYEFTCICFSLCEIWFDVSSPYPYEIESDFVEEVTHRILNDGVFGKENVDNRVNRTAKEMIKENKGFVVGSIIDMTHVIFPSYSNMRYISWYSFIDGRPYLLPVAWVYRWMYVLFHKREKSLRRLTQTIENKDVIERHASYVEQWGL